MGQIEASGTPEVSVTMLVVFTLLLNRTVLGIALRAAADNFRMTRMLGVPATS